MRAALRSRVLGLDEVRHCVDSLRKKRRYNLNRLRLILFRLSTCCGLRVSELTQLRLCDIRLDGLRPCIELPASICKADRQGRRQGRTVPLWWDASTLADLTAWCAERAREGASPTDLVLITRRGTPISRCSAARTFSRLCKCLGRHVSIHDGRHTYITTMLHRGHVLPAVQAAAGHRSLATTSLYTHLMDEPHAELQEVW